MARLNERLQALNDVEQAVVNFDESRVKDTVQAALTKGLTPVDLLVHGLAQALARVGELYDEKEYFLPELIMSIDATAAGLEILKPLLPAQRPHGYPRGCLLMAGTTPDKAETLAQNITRTVFSQFWCDCLAMDDSRAVSAWIDSHGLADLEVIAVSPALAVHMNAELLVSQFRAKNQIAIILYGHEFFPPDAHHPLPSESEADFRGQPLRSAIAMVVHLAGIIGGRNL